MATVDALSTPTMDAALKETTGPRILLCVGSEGGNTRRLVSRTLKAWTAKGATFKCDQMSGNEAVEACGGTLEGIARKYDVILVATCSYGCGEAPINMHMLFDLLKDNAIIGTLNSEGAPLSGLQHAVLGCGSTCYETFQNCPRLHDKWLGECGSRRMVMRAELDDVHELAHNEQPHYLRWVDEVFAALQALPSAQAPPVCEWDQPAGKITNTMSASTTCPTDVAPYVMSAIVAACAAAYGIAWSLGVLPSWLVATS